MIVLRREFDEDEVLSIMNERNLNKDEAESYIYHRDYYRDWIIKNGDRKKEYRKKYYAENRR